MPQTWSIHYLGNHGRKPVGWGVTDVQSDRNTNLRHLRAGKARMARWNWRSLFAASRPNIERMKRDFNTAGLINALLNDDPQVQEEAHAALNELGDSAVSIVIRMLRASKTPKRLRRALVILSQFTSPVACEALCAALYDNDPNTRLTAFEYLKNRTEAEFVGPLLKAAEDDRVTVQIQTLLRQVLYYSASDVPDELLREAAALNDSYVVIFTQNLSSCGFVTFTTSSEEADFSTIKQLARQELIRRGMDA